MFILQSKEVQKLKIRFVLILILSVIICSGFANKPDDALLTFGDGFSFMVNEPEKWCCYTAGGVLLSGEMRPTTVCFGGRHKPAFQGWYEGYEEQEVR